MTSQQTNTADAQIRAELQPDRLRGFSESPKARTASGCMSDSATILDTTEGGLEDFFQSVEQLGGRRTDFNCFFGQQPVDENDTKAILELTYQPTGLARWYDVRQPMWSILAVDDFKRGKFER